MSYKFEFAYADGKIADGNVLAVLITDGTTMSNLSYSDSSLGVGGKVVDSLTVSGLSSLEDLYAETLNFATAGNFTSAVSGGTTPVPEPTSAMLLALGLCGLALKRKRA